MKRIATAGARPAVFALLGCCVLFSAREAAAVSYSTGIVGVQNLGGIDVVAGQTESEAPVGKRMRIHDIDTTVSDVANQKLWHILRKNVDVTLDSRAGYATLTLNRVVGSPSVGTYLQGQTQLSLTPSTHPDPWGNNTPVNPDPGFYTDLTAPLDVRITIEGSWSNGVFGAAWSDSQLIDSTDATRIADPAAMSAALGGQSAYLLDLNLDHTFYTRFQVFIDGQWRFADAVAPYLLQGIDTTGMTDNEKWFLLQRYYHWYDAALYRSADPYLAANGIEWVWQDPTVSPGPLTPPELRVSAVDAIGNVVFERIVNDSAGAASALRQAATLSVPEPSTLACAGLGVLLLAAAARRSRHATRR